MACATARYTQVYALTPRETQPYEMAGMTVIPTQPEELAARLAELKVGTGTRFSCKHWPHIVGRFKIT
jgi:hypothetical protein